jgi:hypothetical protein
MRIEISEGEGLDRLSILELKLAEISDAGKRFEIEKEISTLVDLIPIKIKYDYYYRLMCQVNKKIWDLTNTVKDLVPSDSLFSSIANEIFKWNQSRFRVKSKINELVNSSVKEQKSYDQTLTNISITDDIDYNQLLDNLTTMSLSYDVVCITCSAKVKSYILEKIPEFYYSFIEISD